MVNLRIDQYLFPAGTGGLDLVAVGVDRRHTIGANETISIGAVRTHSIGV